MEIFRESSTISGRQSDTNSVLRDNNDNFAASLLEELFVNQTERAAAAENEDDDRTNGINSYQNSMSNDIVDNTLNVDSKVYSVVVFNPSVRETGDPFVAVGCGDAVIRLYSLDSQLNNSSKRGNESNNVFKPKTQFHGHTESIHSMKVYQPRGQNTVVIVSGSKDRSVRLWVVETETCYKELRGHKDAVFAVDVLDPENGEPLVLGAGLCGKIIMWGLLKGNLLRTFEANVSVMSMVVHRKDEEECRVIAGTEDGNIMIWDLSTGLYQRTIDAHTSSITSLDTMRNYGGAMSESMPVHDQVVDIIVSAGTDKKVHVWHMDTGLCLRTIQNHDSVVFAVKIVPTQMHYAHFLEDTTSETLVVHPSGVDSDDDDDDDDKLSFGDVYGGGSEKTRTTTDKIKAMAPVNGEKLEPDKTYVDEAVIISCSKDRKTVVTSLNTGAPVYTFRNHSKAITCVAPLVTYGDEEGDEDVHITSMDTQNTRRDNFAFHIPGRRFIRCITGSMDQTISICKLESFRKSAFKAYLADKNGYRLPIDILGTIPDEYHVWASVYYESAKRGLTLEEYFCHDSFFLFRQAIMDKRIDFVSLFLQKCPRAMVIASRWYVKFDDSATSSPLAEATSGINEEGDSDDDEDVFNDNDASSIAMSKNGKTDESTFYRKVEISLKEKSPEQFLSDREILARKEISANSNQRMLGNFHSPIENKRKWLAEHGIPRHITNNDRVEIQNERLRLYTDHDNPMKHSLRKFRNYAEKVTNSMHRTICKAIYLPINEDDLEGYSSGKYEYKKYMKYGGFSLLTVALELKDVQSVRIIMNTWLQLCNQPATRCWLDQINGSFVRLRIVELLKLCDQYPLMFQTYICELKMQPCHEYTLRDCNTKVPVGKDFLKGGGVGHIVGDAGFWHTSHVDRHQKSLNHAFYLPIAYCLNQEFLHMFKSVADQLADVSIFRSEVGEYVTRHSWKVFGLPSHLYESFKSVARLLIFSSFTFTVEPQYTWIGVIYVTYSRISELFQYAWFNDIYYFFRFKPFLAFATDGAIFTAVWLRFKDLGFDDLQKENYANQLDRPFYRAMLCFLMISMWIGIMLNLRPYNGTGPVIATIAEITYDIRYFIFVLFLMVLAFATCIWSLCTAQLSIPYVYEWVNPLEGEVPEESSSWLSLPVFGSDSNIEEHTEVLPGNGWMYSTFPASMLSLFIVMSDGGWDTKNFATCGIHSNATINHRARSSALLYVMVFALLVSITMLNILIAIMSLSYERLSERGGAQVFYNQIALIREYSESVALTLEKYRHKRHNGEVLKPKLLYLLGVASLSHEEKDADNNEEEDTDAACLRQTFEASLDFSDVYETQMGEEVEDFEGNVQEGLETAKEISRDLDYLIRLKQAR